MPLIEITHHPLQISDEHLVELKRSLRESCAVLFSVPGETPLTPAQFTFRVPPIGRHDELTNALIVRIQIKDRPVLTGRRKELHAAVLETIRGAVYDPLSRTPRSIGLELRFSDTEWGEWAPGEQPEELEG